MSQVTFKQPVDPNPELARDSNGLTELMKLARPTQLVAFKALLKISALGALEATNPMDRNRSVLHYATLSGDPDVVEALLNALREKKGNINPLDSESPQNSPLDYAKDKGGLDKVRKVLLRYGAVDGLAVKMLNAFKPNNEGEFLGLINAAEQRQKDRRERKGTGVQLPIGGPGDSGVAKLPSGSVVVPTVFEREMQKIGEEANAELEALKVRIDKTMGRSEANVSIHEIIERGGYIKPSNLPKDYMSERNLEGLTPLMHAILKKRETLVRSFLEVATKEDFEAINDRDSNKTVFHYLAESSREIFDIFVNGLSLQEKDVQEKLGKSKASELPPEQKSKFIVWAIGKLHERYGGLDAKVVYAFLSVKFQIKYGVERIDSYLIKQGWNIFGWESIIQTNNASQVAKYFRQNRKALKERNANGLTPLMFAIFKTYIESARWLIECDLIDKDDMEAVNPICFKYSVLHYVVLCGDIRLLNMFLFKLCQLKGNCNPVATMHGTPSELVVSLSQTNPDPDREPYYKQALESLKTCQSNLPQSNFSSLPPMNVSVDDFVDAGGFTPLMKALKDNKGELSKLYLDAATKVDFQAVNRKDKNRSVFHYVYGLRDFKFLEALLAKARKLGVDMNKRDADGKNPLDYVLEQNKGNPDLCDKFISAFAKYGVVMTGEGVFAGTPILSLSDGDPKQQIAQMKGFLDKHPKGPSLNADGEPWDAGIQRLFAQNNGVSTISAERPKVEPIEYKKDLFAQGLTLDESSAFEDFDRDHANLSSGIRNLNKSVEARLGVPEWSRLIVTGEFHDFFKNNPKILKECNSAGYTPLMLAAKMKHKEYLEAFLARASYEDFHAINEKDNNKKAWDYLWFGLDKSNSVHMALYNTFFDAMNNAPKVHNNPGNFSNAPAPAKKSEPNTEFHNAAKADNRDKMIELAKKENRNGLDKDGKTALDYVTNAKMERKLRDFGCKKSSELNHDLKKDEVPTKYIGPSNEQIREKLKTFSSPNFSSLHDSEKVMILEWIEFTFFTGERGFDRDKYYAFLKNKFNIDKSEEQRIIGTNID